MRGTSAVATPLKFALVTGGLIPEQLDLGFAPCELGEYRIYALFCGAPGAVSGPDQIITGNAAMSEQGTAIHTIV